MRAPILKNTAFFGMLFGQRRFTPVRLQRRGIDYDLKAGWQIGIDFRRLLPLHCDRTRGDVSLDWKKRDVNDPRLIARERWAAARLSRWLTPDMGTAGNEEWAEGHLSAIGIGLMQDRGAGRSRRWQRAICGIEFASDPR